MKLMGAFAQTPVWALGEHYISELSAVWFHPAEPGRGHFSVFLFVLPVSPQKMEREHS